MVGSVVFSRRRLEADDDAGRQAQSLRSIAAEDLAVVLALDAHVVPADAGADGRRSL